MLEILNSQNIKSNNNFEEEPNYKLPPLKKKVIIKKPIPSFPNIDVPMSEKEIMEFKKKYPNRNIEFKKEKPVGSEQIELKNMLGSTNQLENTDIYENTPDVVNDNSIVGDAYLEEDRTNNYIKGYWYHKLGNCYSFIADKKGNPLMIIGSKWYIYIIVSLIMQFSMWFFIFFYKHELEKGVKVTGIIMILIFQSIYTIVYISNPGFPRNTVGRMKGIPKEQYKYCSECLFYINKNKKVNHCFKCGLCIEGFHRHSFLINKCIGKKNFYLFYIFIGILLINIIYVIIIICLGNR